MGRGFAQGERIGRVVHSQQDLVAGGRPPGHAWIMTGQRFPLGSELLDLQYGVISRGKPWSAGSARTRSG